MGNFFIACKGSWHLGWQAMVCTLVVAGLGSNPALGQIEPGMEAPSAAPQLLAQASSQQFSQMLFVNPITGDDQRGEGSLRSPFRSITHALQFAESGTVIFLGAGTYNERSGEQFPIVVPPGVQLQEDPTAERESVAIAGTVTQGTIVTARRSEVASEGRSQPPATPAPRPSSPPAEPVATVSIPALPPSAPAATTPSPAPSFSRPSEAIPIPVPPPTTSRPPAPASPAPVALSSGSQRFPGSGTAIEIPVPPPDNPMPARRSRPVSTEVPAAPRRATLAAQPSASRSGPYDLLPVPDPNIPLGYTGDLPRIPIANATRTASISQGAGGTVSRGAGNLRYRVLVRAENERVRSWVQSVMPDAFETQADGEMMMQIGAFQNLENAEEAAEQLSRSGIRAIIEEWR